MMVNSIKFFKQQHRFPKQSIMIYVEYSVNNIYQCSREVQRLCFKAKLQVVSK